MKIITNQSTSDVYSDALTIQNIYESAGGSASISGADVWVELQYGRQGELLWTDEVHIPVGALLFDKNTFGVRFRSFTPGTPAVISASLSERYEPPIVISSSGTTNNPVSGFSVFNVAAPPYNAKGDGNTDNQSAFNKAALDAAAAGGGYIYVPGSPSDYMISAPIVLPEGVTLIGEGTFASRIDALNSFVGAAMVINQKTDGTQEYAGIRDLGLNARNVAAKCIYFERIFVNTGIERVLCQNAVSHGIHLSTNIGGAAGPYYLRDCWALSNGGDNVRIENAIRGCWIQNLTSEGPGNGNAALRITSTGGTSQTHYILGLHLENFSLGNTCKGVVLDNIIGCLIDGVNLAGTAGTAWSDLITLQNNCRGIEVKRIAGYQGIATNVIVDSDNSIVIPVSAAGNFFPSYSNEPLTPGGSAPIPFMRSGAFFAGDANITTQVQADGNGNAYPFTIASGQKIVTIGIEVTATSPASNVRLGIYADNEGIPGKLIVDAGTIDSHTATGFFFITINLTLTGGIYWLVSVAQGGTPTLRANSGPGSGEGRAGYGAALTTSQNNPIGYNTGAGQIPGALPGTFPISNATAALPRVILGT